MLITTEVVTTLEEAIKRVQWYAYRWRIERLHHILKSGGCQVENLQLRQAERLRRAIAFYTIVAWRLLWITYTVREEPNQPCTNVFSPAEAEVLEIYRQENSPKKARSSPPTEGVMTLREAVRVMAQMGGFLGRKGDGDPGVKVLWRGYRQLQAILLGVRLAKKRLLQ